jgi:hypothetical protein
MSIAKKGRKSEDPLIIGQRRVPCTLMDENVRDPFTIPSLLRRKGFGLSPFRASCYNASMELRHRITIATLLIAGAIIVLGRARYWVSSDRLGILHWGTWAIVGVMVLSAIANFASSSSLERFQKGPAALLLALLCLVVARSQ